MFHNLLEHLEDDVHGVECNVHIFHEHHLHNLIIILTTLVLLLSTISSYAQELRGKVLEVSGQDTSAVEAALVKWLRTDIGTYTDANGQFTLRRAKTDTLLVTYPLLPSDTIVVPKSLKEVIINLDRSKSLPEIRIVSGDGSYVSTKPILTTVITQEGLRRAACCNLAESFEGTIAVDMDFTDAVTGVKQISMLGLAGTYSQIMIENVPYIRLLTQQFGLGFVPGSWMESIHVSKGVTSVTNGYEAISGQIDVEYKKPETNREQLFLNLYGNSMGRGEINLNTRFNVDKKERVSTMFLLSANDQFAKMDMNKDGFMDAPRDRQVSVMNRWDIRIPNKYSNRTLLNFVWNNRFGGQMAFKPSVDTLGNNTYGIIIDHKKWDVITKNGFILEGPDESVGTILHYTGHYMNGLFGRNRYTGKQHSAYLNVLYSRKFGKQLRHKMTVGGSFQFDYLYDLLTNDDDIEHFAPYSVARWIDEMYEMVPGIFAEYAYILNDKLVVMPGFRLDYNIMYNRLFWTPRLHIKWQATPTFSIRLSAGKGYRTPSVLAENLSLLTSNRRFQVKVDNWQPDEAYNMGISFIKQWRMRGGTASVSADYFYTTFVTQTIIDLNQDPHSIFVYNLNGDFNGTGNRSRSHAAQVELILKPLPRFELLFAYRYNDVRHGVRGVMQQKEMSSPHKGIASISYNTKYDKWKFNITLHVNGPARLPNTHSNPTEYQRPDYSKTYALLNAQITKKFRRWEIYVGAENMLNYKQKDPIVAAEDPFGDFFDATMIYAPITGIMGYAGVRIILQ
ncbi:MAG: TonB-dependent receptor [Bacteroidales bacterium]|nr:TonB-dependent receptor [Bacteroidales bacterium]